jgi:hypothetical protein
MIDTEQKQKDASVFGDDAWIYCDQHLRPHRTGWCSVDVRNKTALEATDEKAAYAECQQRGFKIYGDKDGC